MTSNRPPIVVVLGHVDHGKTTLLDHIRKSNKAEKEAGGITQHISSFQIKTPNAGQITFIDTPGHEAFAAMRQRGSKIADIAMLVVAGNDGVMPQTKQSIEFIKQAKIPTIVAISKADLPSFDAERVKSQLAESGMIVESLGGETPTVAVSAKTGSGVGELMELISLISQLHPPMANPDGELEAVVLESRMDKNKGPTAVLIIKDGTIKVGQTLYQGQVVGKVKALMDWDGKALKEASPAMPVEVMGLNKVVDVGSILSSAERENKTTVVSEQYSVSKSGGNGINQDSESINVILKTDFQGSLEAILSCIPEGISVVKGMAGPIVDSDIEAAKMFKAVVVGFNNKPGSDVAKLAQTEKVKVENFSVIYELLEYLQQLKTPKLAETVTGEAKVLAEFKIDRNRIAGCKCISGEIKRGDQVKVVRGNLTVGVSAVKSLKVGKTAAEKVKSGSECGILLGPAVDFKLQDSIIAFTTTHDKS